MENNVIVIGALGQDGSYMCDVLNEFGYTVIGIVKESTDINRYRENVIYLPHDISSIKNISNLLNVVKPIAIYNFMGITDVFSPWDKADVVYDNNFSIPLKIIESIRIVNKSIKFFQASSSLVFGATDISPQTEQTERLPIYHYGIAKNFTDQIIKTYREKFNMFLCSGILYTHESERRADKFFMKKLIDASYNVSIGKQEYVELGDISEHRDIGYAKDYMYACLKIMQYHESDDYIISTGISTKLEDVIDLVFNELNLDKNTQLRTNTDFKRDYNVSHLIGDNTKLQKLGWRPIHSVKDIVKIMINDKK